MKSFLALALAFVFATLSSVSAHGYVNDTIIAGKQFAGFDPNYDLWDIPDSRRITREVPNDGPVTDITSLDLRCNVGAQDAQWRTPSHAAIAAGENVTFVMVRWPADHLGPITVYMAYCGEDCTNYDGDGNVWFKIDQAGLISGNTDTGKWASTLLIANNLGWTVTIPEGLKAGAYLIRFEILAMQVSGAPQFYPSCTQLIVTGSGTQSPSADEMTAIPGQYTQDQSIQIDIWTNGQSEYTIAGPAVTKLAKYETNPVNLNGGVPVTGYPAGTIVKAGDVNLGATASTSSDSGSSSGDAGTGAGAGSGSGGVTSAGTSVSSAGAVTIPSGSTKACKVKRARKAFRRRHHAVQHERNSWTH